MKTAEAIKAIMSSKEVNQSMLARRLQVTPTAINLRLARNFPTLEQLLETARTLDYEVVLVPAGSRKPDGSYTITDAKSTRTSP